ncbi:hypothetical protein [Synechococcus sp. PCC 7336]|nr:hypothetical protein [Synechococcus sp. PCC 7336]
MSELPDSFDRLQNQAKTTIESKAFSRSDEIVQAKLLLSEIMAAIVTL